jgi:hypothetical protein
MYDEVGPTVSNNQRLHPLQPFLILKRRNIMTFNRLFKLMRFFSNTLFQQNRNKTQWRDWVYPIQFPNQFTGEKEIQPFCALTATTIVQKQIQTSHNKPYIYVILTDGTLIISEQEPIFFDGIGGPIFVGRKPHHSSLAKLGPVLSAGEVFVVVRQGKAVVEKINNDSGHYIPVGDHLRELTERAFEDNGFDDVKGKYTESDYIGSDPTTRKLQPICDLWNPRFFANTMTSSLLRTLSHHSCKNLRM